MVSSQQHAEGSPLFPRRKILVVSQDQVHIDRWRASLAQAGYAVCTCASFDEGAQSLRAERFDFIILEQASPAFEGRVVLERAREIDPTARVLILSSCPEMSRYLVAMDLGALDYLDVPPPGSLVPLVDIYLSQRN
jgi:DNA-binding response OmpR family regulator